MSTQLGVPMGSGRGASTSRSPIGTARTLASKIFAKDSVGSTASPFLDTVWTARNNYAMDIQLLFKRRITNLYLSIMSLKSYVELNHSGFRKILKKYVRRVTMYRCNTDLKPDTTRSRKVM